MNNVIYILTHLVLRKFTLNVYIYIYIYIVYPVHVWLKRMCIDMKRNYDNDTNEQVYVPKRPHYRCNNDDFMMSDNDNDDDNYNYNNIGNDNDNETIDDYDDKGSMQMNAHSVRSSPTADHMLPYKHQTNHIDEQIHKRLKHVNTDAYIHENYLLLSNPQMESLSITDNNQSETFPGSFSPLERSKPSNPMNYLLNSLHQERRRRKSINMTNIDLPDYANPQDNQYEEQNHEQEYICEHIYDENYSLHNDIQNQNRLREHNDQYIRRIQF